MITRAGRTSEHQYNGDRAYSSISALTSATTTLLYDKDHI